MCEGGKVICQPVRGCLAFVQISQELLDVADDISAPFSFTHLARIDFFVVPTLFSFFNDPCRQAETEKPR